MADRNILVVGDGDRNGQVLAEDIINPMGAALTGAATLRKIVGLNCQDIGPVAGTSTMWPSTGSTSSSPVGRGGRWEPTEVYDPLPCWASHQMITPYTGRYLIEISSRGFYNLHSTVDFARSGLILKIVGTRYRLAPLIASAVANEGYSSPVSVVVSLTATEQVSFWTSFISKTNASVSSSMYVHQDFLNTSVIPAGWTAPPVDLRTKGCINIYYLDF